MHVVSKKLHDTKANFRLLVKQAQEFLTVDEIHAAGCQCLGRDFVRLIGNRRAQAEQLARLRDLDNPLSLSTQIKNQSGPSLTEQINALRRLSFGENERAFWEGASPLHDFKSPHSLR